MFRRSASFYDALYSFMDYGAAVRELRRVFDSAAPHATRLLDVGCGTGRHLELLRERYEVEGVDLNPDMLRMARKRCPGVTFHEADMADFSLGRCFDVVTCLFSSIAYVRTEARMRSAILCMRQHLNPGGVLVIEPWFSPETYWTGTITANHVDEPELKIAWMYTSERKGPISVLDIHYLVGRPGGIETFRERHELGLFTIEQHLAAFRDAGLEARHEAGGPFGRGLYVACPRPDTS
jgi:ubiquinone/menaquinone biosynthesis C-methylase UbiE